MAEVARSGDVTLVQLGHGWEFLSIVEGATTLQEILQGRRIPADRKSTRLNSSHIQKSRMPSSA